LADFQARLPAFSVQKISLVAASAESEVEAATTVECLGLEFPVGFGLAAADVAAMLGGFVSEDRRHFHAAGFVIRPDGRVATAVYSTGAVGRLTSADSLGLIGFQQLHSAP
jgi:hypothetical protein